MRLSDFYFAFLILTAYVLTIFGVGWWRGFALRRRLLDVPNERSSHRAPTPRGGGVVIFVVTCAFLGFWAGLSGEFFELLPFFIGAGLVAAVSWLDDLFGLPSLLRLIVHLIAAAIVIWGIGFFRLFDSHAASDFNLLTLAEGILTALWIVGLTNAYNFMDGIDGIAGTQGLIAGAGWSLLGFLSDQPIVSLFGGLAAATNLGFLWHNWHPARIFMGDVGSAFLGYSLAVLPILAFKKTGGAGDWAIVGALLAWTFVFDTILTFARRLLGGENVFAAHRSHLYQRLVIAGYSHRAVALGYGLLACLGVGLAFLTVGKNQNSPQIELGIVAAMCLMLWLWVRKSEKKL